MSTHRATFATLHPNSLPRQPRFWLSQPRVLGLFLITSLLIGLLFYWNVIPVEGAKAVFQGEFPPEALAVLVQGTIFIIGLYAFAVGISALARLIVERDYSERVADRIQEELREIQSGKRIQLSDVPNFWPNNPERGLASLRLCDAIHQDAIDSHFGSKESMLQHYREESHHRLDAISNLQRITLYLGILGTFMGLAFVLPELQKIGSEEFRSFDLLFRNLRVCFLTSVVGLVVAIAIGLFSLILSKYQEQFFERLEEAAAAMLAIARKAHNREALPRTFDQLNNSIREFHVEATKQTRSLGELSRSVSDGLKKLAIARSDVDTLVAGVDSLKTEILTRVESVTKQVQGHGLLDRVEARMDESVGSILAGMEKTVQPVKESYAELNGSIASLTQVIEAMQRSQLTQAQETASLNQSLSSGFTDFGSTLNGNVDKLKAERESLSGVLQTYRTSVAADMNSRKELLDRLEDRVQTSMSKVVDDFSKGAEVFPNSVSNLDSCVKTLARSTKALSDVVEQQRAELGANAQLEQLRNTIQHFLSELSRLNRAEDIIRAINKGNQDSARILAAGIERLGRPDRALVTDSLNADGNGQTMPPPVAVAVHQPHPKKRWFRWFWRSRS